MRTFLAIVTITATLGTGSSAPVAVHDPSGPSATVEYAPGVVLDRYEPSTLRTNAPVVVLVHGCCGDRRDLSALARALTRHGAVTLNADVHNVRDDGGWRTTYDDVICAVAWAHDFAARLSHDHHPVVLVGWSDGALVGATVALGWRNLAPNATKYAAKPAPSAPPERFVGLSGYYGWPEPQVPDTLVNTDTTRWFGAPPDVDPDAWRQGNAWSWITTGTRTVSFLLLSGSTDPLSRNAHDFATALVAQGITTTHGEIANGRHLSLAQPRGEIGAAALAMIIDTLGLAER